MSSLGLQNDTFHSCGTLKERMLDASRSFRKKNARHFMRNQDVVYCAFSMDGFSIPPNEAQRDACKRFMRFGMDETILKGKSVLDLGSNMGAMLFQATNYGISRGVGIEYDEEKVRISQEISRKYLARNVSFVQGDIDTFDFTGMGKFDIVFALAVEGHLLFPEKLYAVLGMVTRERLFFEGNGNCNLEKTIEKLENAGFRKVQYLGLCDDDRDPRNNNRPLLVAEKQRWNCNSLLEGDLMMKTLLERLHSKESILAVVGLGYVGIPLAVAYAEHFSVIGYDSNREKIAKYLQGIDPTEELEEGALASTKMEFTSDPGRLSEASFIIIAVPTPIHGDKTPDLEPLKGASETVGRHLAKGSIVVYESTVYPGVTEEVCCPILERESGLKCGVDFKIGYSPERINPGDKVHRLRNITKIVSGMDSESLEAIASVYETVIDQVYRAPSIRVAEAAKLVENSQRDINIAFMNELAMVFHRMDIDTGEVVKAMGTKWNALGFQPGLVGGHCIGVDPYYFIYKAQNLGYYSQMISVGRRINNGMSDFVIQEAMRIMVQARLDVSHAKICLMGMTFKEDCPDTRNSRAIDIYRKMREYGLEAYAVDPLLDPADFQREHGISLVGLPEVSEADCLVFLVAHKEFRELGAEGLLRMFRKTGNGNRVVMDVKHIFARDEVEAAGFLYWSL